MRVVSYHARRPRIVAPPPLRSRIQMTEYIPFLLLTPSPSFPSFFILFPLEVLFSADNLTRHPSQFSAPKGELDVSYFSRKGQRDVRAYGSLI